MAEPDPSIAQAPAPSGPPLVLVAGLAGSGNWWDAVGPFLATGLPGRAMATVDLPGFGSRGGHRRLQPIVQAAETLAEEIVHGAAGEDEAGVVDLVGYSLGGSVCLRLAAARPELVRRLVLIAPGGVPVARSTLRDLVSMVHMGFLAGPCFWPTLVRDARRAGARAMLAAAKDVRFDDARALLPQVVAPTLVLHGDRDTLVPGADCELIAAGIPGARLQLLPGIGHTPMAECPEKLAAAIAAFLR